MSAGVASPIKVHGRLWGALAAISHKPGPLPPDTESRVAQFGELVATAIANAEARSEAARLADEQAALWRVATLVAEGAGPTVVFDAVTSEVGELLAPTRSRCALRSRAADHRSRAPRAGPGTTAGGNAPAARRRQREREGLQTGRPARIDDFSATTGSIAEVPASSA